MDSYIATITGAAEMSIPKGINTNMNKYCVPWRNAECSKTTKNKKMRLIGTKGSQRWKI